MNNAMDTVRNTNLSVISAALTMYYNDKWMYPKELNKLVPNYLLSIPEDPQWQYKLYFYRSLMKNWASQWWAILWAQMENTSKCNINAYSENDLDKIIKENNNEIINIKKNIMKKNESYHKWCYYVLIN